jgi:hypothetical protein
VNDERERENAPRDEKPGTPWGFFLVLAAIVVVAVVYSVTILAIGREDRTPEVVFGAMAVCFTVIGMLVDTYFGVKAGLDGQDKMRQTFTRVGYGSSERPQDGTERNGKRVGAGKRAEDEQRAAREFQDAGKGAHVERRDWDGGSV